MVAPFFTTPDAVPPRNRRLYCIGAVAGGIGRNHSAHLGFAKLDQTPLDEWGNCLGNIPGMTSLQSRHTAGIVACLAQISRSGIAEAKEESCLTVVITRTPVRV